MTGGPPEVDERGEVLAPGVVVAGEPPPVALGLAQPPLGEREVAARARAERLGERHAGDEHGRAVRGADRLERGGADLGVGLGGAAEPRQRLGAPQPRLGALHRRVAGERAAEQLRRALVVAGQQREQPAVVVGDRASSGEASRAASSAWWSFAARASSMAPEPRERVGAQAGHVEVDGRGAARCLTAPRCA